MVVSSKVDAVAREVDTVVTMANEGIKCAFLASEHWMAPSLGGQAHLTPDSVLPTSRIELYCSTDRVSCNLEAPAAPKTWHLINEALLGHLDLLFDSELIGVNRVRGPGPSHPVILLEVRRCESLISGVDDLGADCGVG